MRGISREEFAEIWNSSSSVEEATRRAGRTSARSTSVWASKLRKDGIDLKTFQNSGPPPLPADEFTRRWNAAETLGEFAEQNGFSKRIASARATTLRKAGHNLKKFGAPSEDELREIWNSSATAEEVAIRTGLSVGYIRNLIYGNLGLQPHPVHKGNKWHWLGGYFDGRGSFIQRRSGQARLSFSGDEPTLCKIQEMLGGGTIERNKNSLRLQWTGRDEIVRVGSILSKFSSTRGEDLGIFLRGLT